MTNAKDAPIRKRSCVKPLIGNPPFHEQVFSWKPEGFAARRSKAVVHSEDHGFDLACWQVRSMTTAVNARLYNSSTSANARNRETCRPIGDQRGYCGVCPPMQFRKTEDGTGAITSSSCRARRGGTMQLDPRNGMSIALAVVRTQMRAELMATQSWLRVA